jgi:hypothetical protein
MTLSRSQSVFGIHSICAYNPDTFEPYGIAKVVGSLAFQNSGEQIPLHGGSSLYPWEIEAGIISAEGSFLFKEVPDWSFQAFQGAAATTNAAETGGAATTIANINGTSAVAATGILSVGVESGQEAEVKTGLYMVKVVTATTVDVYALTDVDFRRGTDLTYQNDALKITASPLTIATSTAVTIPNTGLELTGGGGTIAMTVGDTAWFDARSINTGSTTVTVGADGNTFLDTGILCAAQKKGNSEIFLLDLMRVKATGFPFNLTEKAWMESEISFQPI